ncbi:selenocysteinyl-tRNA-specific translation factor domain protein [Yersinia pestis PY-101]|nr:selenocysteinyl-tRNA-specific translation factor domain protein [Yersinia pestis PY-101]
MTGDVNKTHDTAIRKWPVGIAQIDGHPPLLLFRQPIRINPGNGL